VSDQKTTTYVTTSELKSELRAMRWEVRFLIALASAANLGLAKVLSAPGTVAAMHILHHLV
jgi:hypothetical protein